MSQNQAPIPVGVYAIVLDQSTKCYPYTSVRGSIKILEDGRIRVFPAGARNLERGGFPAMITTTKGINIFIKQLIGRHDTFCIKQSVEGWSLQEQISGSWLTCRIVLVPGLATALTWLLTSNHTTTA